MSSPLLKRIVLELGGKSALIVRADADLGAAAATAYNSFTLHAGQGCVLLTRHIVHRSVAADFLAELSVRAAGTVVGDPASAATTMGPLISSRQKERVLGYIQSGQEQGGRLAVGGADIDSPGYFVAPTVITDVSEDARVVQEEIFGPVAVVLPFDTDDEAVRIANNSNFGLSGGVFSASTGAAWNIARQLRTGTVRINGGSTALDLEAPTSGVKFSGLGTEHGIPGLLEFTNLKSISFRAG